MITESLVMPIKQIQFKILNKFYDISISICELTERGKLELMLRINKCSENRKDLKPLEEKIPVTAEMTKTEQVWEVCKP